MSRNITSNGTDRQGASTGKENSSGESLVPMKDVLPAVFKDVAQKVLAQQSFQATLVNNFDCGQTVDELMKKDYPEEVELFGGLLYANRTSLIHGIDGAGKTMQALYIASCVASGRNWGPYPTTLTRVALISTELPEVELLTRVRRQLDTMFGDDEESKIACQKNIVLFGEDTLEIPFDFIEDGPDLTAFAKKHRIGLIILDSLSDTHTQDDSSQKEMTPVIRAINKVRLEVPCSVLVFHHNSKAGSYRGSTLISQRMSLRIFVSCDRNGKQTLRFDKVRGFERPKDSIVMYILPNGGVEYRSAENDPAGVLLKAIQATPDATDAQLAAVTGIALGSINHYRKKLRKTGQLDPDLE